MEGKITYYLICAVLLLHELPVTGQSDILSLGPWNLKSVSGELGIEALYQERNNQLFDVLDEQNSTYFIGGIKLNSNSYFWKPDIVSISLNGEYNPETRDEKYLSIPNRSEVRTLKKVDFRTTVFNDKNINLNAWTNYNQSYFNRENLTNVKSDNKQWGTLFAFNNKVLPLTIRYMNLAWDQTETETNRTFNMMQHGLQTKFTRSFFKTDQHDLSYSYDDYTYVYADQNAIANKVNHVVLNNSIFLAENNRSGIRSHMSYYKQSGTRSFNKFDVNEVLFLRLPKQLTFRSAYNFHRMEDFFQLTDNNRVNSTLRHQLYESLTSEVFGEYSATKHTIYREAEFKGGGELRYTKKVPFGQLNLGYKYYRQHHTIESTSGVIQVINEAHSLNDIAGIFLDRPYVERSSILVTDITGTIVFEEGPDYLLNEVNNFIEIIRVPGGQIEQDQEVLLSYSAIQPGTSHYEANNHSYHASLSMFSRLLELYYRGGQQDMQNVEAAEFLTLNEYDQNIIGTKIYYRFITGGVEYDHYLSNLIPYKRVNYYLNLHFKISSKLILSANGTLRDYKLLDTDINHKYTNVSGRVSYSIGRHSKANFQVGYLSQRGRNINLDLLSGRLDFVTNYRKMYFKTGVTIYNRSYTNSIFTYTRTYIQLSRKF